MSENKTKKPRKKSLKFTFDQDAKRGDGMSVDGLVQGVRDEMKKSVQPIEIRPDLIKRMDTSKLTFSSFQTKHGSNTEEKTIGRLTDEELRHIAQIDPDISAIISKRTAQSAIIGRPSDSKFDKGTRIQDLNPPSREDFETDKDYKVALKTREKKMKILLDWLLTCGYADQSLLNTIFNNGDQLYKYCTFAEYITAQVRNILTFGRAGMYIIRDENGLPAMFRPIAIDTIKPYRNTEQKVSVPGSPETSDQSIEDAEEWNKMTPEERPYAYVQKVDGMEVQFFTEQDLKVCYFQKQAYFGLEGYPLAPIEMAIYMVSVHRESLTYLKNQFIKGITTKSLLTIKSTDPSVQIPDEDLNQLRNDFHNYVLRTDNSAVTPVIAGPYEVNVVPLTLSSKDMEFLQLEDHIIRSLCSAMQITPQEMGYGYLGEGNGGLGNNNKQEEIIRGEETGLRMLLDTIYDQVNQVMEEAFEGFKENFRIVYVGVGEDTRDNVIQRSAQEMQTTATMNSLMADSEKTEVVPFGGDVPLSTTFHQNVVRYMKYSEFRYHFLKDDSAMNKPEYDFIIDPAMQQTYSTLLVNPVKTQQEAAQMQIQAQAAQMAMAQNQGQAQNQDPNQDPNQEPEHGQKQSLAQKYAEMQESDQGQSDEQLQKSIDHYFSAWMESHDLEKLD